MNKMIITRLDGRILTLLTEDFRAVQIDADEQEPSILGNIYIGKVKDIAKNINAAFVDLGCGVTGYYSLDANPVHHFAAPVSLREGPDGQSRPLRPGDEILVQVSRDAVKTKAPVLSAYLNLPGRYCVLTALKTSLSFSGKIADKEWKRRMSGFLMPEKDDDLGVIVRTNAADAEPEEVLEEFRRLKARYRRILESGRFRTCYSLLYSELPPYIARLRDAYDSAVQEILTDDPEICEAVKRYLAEERPRDLEKLRFYQDPLLPLSKLYSVEKILHDALQKKVWLKSGGYLVVEPTEALTAIDVNTGKYSGKKLMRETIRLINLEAAEEIARQLRLRNLSGIILVDFINMESQADRDELMRVLTAACEKDPVRTVVVDMTRLNLAELTRKRIRKPLHEQVSPARP